MEAQIVRYRATRKHVFGILNVAEFECFVMERRTAKLDVGAYEVTLSDYARVVRIGDRVVTHDKFATMKCGMQVGSSIKKDRLEETQETGDKLVHVIIKCLQEGVLNLEVIDEADYDEADSELA